MTNYVALAATHYTCMAYGVVHNFRATHRHHARRVPNGMIVPGTGLNMKTCSDGTSKTLMICETIEPAGNCWYDGTTAWTTGINPNRHHSRLRPPTMGIYWVAPSGSSDGIDVGPAPTASVAYSSRTGHGCRWPANLLGTEQQSQRGVVVHGAVDGSVHNMAPDTDPTVYMHIITRNGREPDALPDTVNVISRQ